VGRIGTVGGEPEPGTAMSMGSAASSQAVRSLQGPGTRAASSGSWPGGPWARSKQRCA
jgi:hypothetical protein